MGKEAYLLYSTTVAESACSTSGQLEEPHWICVPGELKLLEQ